MSTIIPETSANVESIATRVWVDDRMVFVELVDGRVFGFPADRFRILSSASNEALKEVTLEVGGRALRWDSLDEDISVAGVISGRFQLPLNS